MLKLDHASPVPLKAQVESLLRAMAQKPEYQKGALLPDEVALANELGVSRGTVRCIARIEAQLVSADGLEVRMTVDAAYERVVNTMFESLKQMAKMEGEGEDKGQLNYHVILIGEIFPKKPSIITIGSY